MKLLIASITNAPKEVLEPHIQTVLWQQLPDAVEVDYFYLVDPEAPDSTVQVLDDYGIEHDTAGPKPDNADYAVREQTHDWTVPTFHWLAKEKQGLLDLAQIGGYDALVLVDSDLLLDGTAVASLIHADKPVVSGVFWTSWQAGEQPLPQVWLRHPYGLENGRWQMHEFLEQLEGAQLVEVKGLGAFTLMRRDAFPKLKFWPLVEGLPNEGMWQGEDRHFCVHANRNHVPLWADGWPYIYHIYRPSDQAHVKQAMKRLKPREPCKPAVGDWVSFRLTPMEDPNLAGYSLPIRGRLGALDVLPEIEAALTEMLPGDERMLQVSFPLHWPVEPYRGHDKVVRLELYDVRNHDNV